MSEENNTNLVCIPFHDFKIATNEGYRTRDSHLYKHFSENILIKNLIIFNRPTLMIELLLRRKKYLSKGEVIYKKYPLTITKYKENCYVVDILDISIISPLINGKGFIARLYEKNAKIYKIALELLKIEKYSTYESSPLTVDLVKKLSPKFRAFDGVDNLIKHFTYRKYKVFLDKAYGYAIKNYELVVFNSTDSIKYFNVEDMENVFLVPNGVDYEKFQLSNPMPNKFKTIGKPIIVYAGKMGSIFDCELVAELAEKYQDYNFVFLGKILEGNIDEKFRSYKNVFFLGDIYYEDLPAFITNSTLCIIPYKEEKWHGGDPIKFYEYMAANKPIITTRIGEIGKFHNGKSIFVVKREEFSDSIQKAMNSNIDNIIHVLPGNITWKEKSEWFVDKIKRRGL